MYPKSCCRRRVEQGFVFGSWIGFVTSKKVVGGMSLVFAVVVGSEVSCCRKIVDLGTGFPAAIREKERRRRRRGRAVEAMRTVVVVVEKV